MKVGFTIWGENRRKGPREMEGKGLGAVLEDCITFKRISVKKLTDLDEMLTEGV